MEEEKKRFSVDQIQAQQEKGESEESGSGSESGTDDSQTSSFSGLSSDSEYSQDYRENSQSLQGLETPTSGQKKSVKATLTASNEK